MVHDLVWRKCSSFSLYPQMKSLYIQKFGCTPKNEGKRVHVPPDEKTCGHTEINLQTVNFLVFLLEEIGSDRAHCECMRKFASFVNCFLQN